VFRNIAIIFFVLCLSVPVFSQQPPSTNPSVTTPRHEGGGMWPMRGMATDQEIDRSVETLQRSLNLTPSQATSIRDLARTRRDSLRAVREQARPKFEQLMTMLRSPNPDPAAVGRVVIDLKAVHEQARAKQAEVDKQLTGILNPAQQQTVNTLRNQAPTFVALRRLGLLGTAGSPHGFMSSTNSPDSRASDEEY
jgi:Spy/CpxP family protein refolding chaperone